MKTSIVLIFIVLLAACNPTKKEATLKSIEPGNYAVCSWGVKDVSYHDTVAKWVSGRKITLSGENKFEAPDSLGSFLFNGNSFNYKLVGDSLVLSNGASRKSYKIKGSSSKFFELYIDNKYLEFVGLIKQGEQKAEASNDSITN